MTNVDLARNVIQELLNNGTREFCLCAGARNSPFIHLFEANPEIKTFHFFDERSAAFFALGRILETGRPTAVVTTSGTAVAETLAAAVEGTYSSLPLILITADRPKNYRGTGAPQSIEQVGIFSAYVEACFDLDEDSAMSSLNPLSWKAPLQFNVCFKEPLQDGTIGKLTVPAEASKNSNVVDGKMSAEVQDFLAKHNPLVLLSTVPEKNRGEVLSFLKKLKAPVYAEGISGLRGHADLKDFEIRSGEKMLARLIADGHCDSIIRIGGVPTVRLWRDLEDKLAKLPVLSLGFNQYSGLSRIVKHFRDLQGLSQIEIKESKSIAKDVQTIDADRLAKAEELFKKYPRSEPGMVHAFSKHVGGQNIYLGNSLPIREWDLAATFKNPPANVAANRGANGIDGQISTFLGWSKKNSENWCMVGDLTAMYDLGGPWVTKQLQTGPLRIVVINNGGGMIFQRMFGKDIFLNRHDTQFKAWGDLWKWGYSRFDEVPAKFDLQDKHIIELSVSEQQTADFWQEWNATWA